MDSSDVSRIETRHRRIVTRIPAPGTREVMERISACESSNALTQIPVVWDRASGYQIFDPWGNCWIDFSSTIFVANCGHAHPHMVKAVRETAENLLHAYSYPTEIRARYLEKLIAFTPDHIEKASLFSTGTEASERAIKLARLHGMRSDPVKRIIVGWDRNFHGKTMGAQMAGGYHDQKDWIGYHDPNMVHMPFPYPWILEKSGMTGEQLFCEHLEGLLAQGVDLSLITAFIIETYQGWCAVFYPEDYIKAMRRWADERDVLLIFDEMQAGFGRTGKLFGYQHYGVKPDLVACGKGISGSLPLSAVIGRSDIIDLDPAYTSTHGGHPMSCAAGLANIEIFEKENLIEESRRKGEVVEEQLNRWAERFPPRIGRISGKGLVWGIFVTVENGGPEDVDPEFCNAVMKRSLEKGVFNIWTGCGTIKLGPPLNIPDDALLEGLSVIEESIAELI